jgi:hypothetical protein
LTCADGQDRDCFPIIAGFTVDYEEQTLITGVKSLQHCTICNVAPKKRENLEAEWQFRTHKSTRAQISRQEKEGTPQTDANWVHPFKNFAWDHYLLNIHKAMMVDVLHQLLKGMIMHLLDWIKTVMKDLLRLSSRQGGDIGIDLRHLNYVQLLDLRFQQIPKYPGLKTFHQTPFSKVTQWTGNEQKGILHQLAAAIYPILNQIDGSTRSDGKAIMHFTRALMDFIMMAHYHSHDEETLEHMESALHRMNLLKDVFRDARKAKPRKGKAKPHKGKATGDRTNAAHKNPSENQREGHFNFPKWPSMVLFPYVIRQFGSAMGVEAQHSVMGHRCHSKA